MKLRHPGTKVTLVIGAALIFFGGFTARGQAPTPTPVAAPSGPPVVLGSGIAGETQLYGGQANMVARWARFPRRDTVPDPNVGWHYHPNYSFYVVTQGTLTVEDGCGGITKYSAGQAFEKTDGRIHRGYVVDDPSTPEDEGAVDEYEYQMYVRPIGTPFAVDVQPRLTHGVMMNPCGPVRAVEECKGDAWMRFNYPAEFKNQGECIAYAINRKRITLLAPDVSTQ